jgi:hypothetical protein
LRSWTHFHRDRGRRVSFSCFPLTDPFQAKPRVPSPIFWFRAPGLVFGRIPGASGTIFMFSAVGLIFGGTRASGPVFTFCTPGLVLGGTECARSHSHVLRSQTRFRQFSFLLDLELVWGNTKGASSRFHVLRSSTRFRWYRGCLVPFACFALPGSFSTVSRASSSVFMFCASRFVFDGTEGVISLFLVLRSRTCFWRYRGRQISFSCFTLLDSIWALLSTSYPFFMFCAPGLVFDDTEGVRSCFHVLRSQTRLRQFQGRHSSFHVSRSRTLLGQYRGHQVLISCFALQ